MNPKIASIHERMAQGGDWMTFREEISRLHGEAKTQDEYVTLLEAHRNLMAVAENCFEPEQCAEIRLVGKAEYKMFLNVEAMEGDLINPVMLDRITAREVESGRMAPDDGLRNIAQEGRASLGDITRNQYDRRLGDLIGIMGIALGAMAFFLISKVVGILVFVIGMVSGWIINDRRQKQLMQRTKLDRLDRRY